MSEFKRINQFLFLLAVCYAIKSSYNQEQLQGTLTKKTRKKLPIQLLRENWIQARQWDKPNPLEESAKPK